MVVGSKKSLQDWKMANVTPIFKSVQKAIQVITDQYPDQCAMQGNEVNIEGQNNEPPDREQQGSI